DFKGFTRRRVWRLGFQVWFGRIWQPLIEEVQLHGKMAPSPFPHYARDGGRSACLDTLTVGARESVWHVHAGHERTVTAGTGRVTVQATWPKFPHSPQFSGREVQAHTDSLRK